MPSHCSGKLDSNQSNDMYTEFLDIKALNDNVKRSMADNRFRLVQLEEQTESIFRADGKAYYLKELNEVIKALQSVAQELTNAG